MSGAGWRSLLFVPAHVPRFVEGASRRGADALVLDLEDAVPPGEKARARAGLAASVAAAGRGGAAVLVRVNAPLLDLARDLEAAVIPGVSALMLPKAEEAGMLRAVSAAIGALEASRGLPAGAVRLVPQVETPAALFRLPEIAAADPRSVAITLGPEDLCAALGAVPGEASLLGPGLALVAAARAAGLVPLGLVGTLAEYGDAEALAATVAASRRLGYRGALAVHPSQVPVFNAGFRPSEAELAWARRVVEAARGAGGGAFALDGAMVDAPVLRRAEGILALAGPAP